MDGTFANAGHPAAGRRIATVDRTIAALGGEMEQTSAIIENGVTVLSGDFEELSALAVRQSELLEQVIEKTRRVAVGPEHMEFAAIAGELAVACRTALGRAERIAFGARAMLGVLDTCVAAVAEVENLTRRIEQLNKQTVMLSLNAKIEANRAGEMGRGFGVVANEVRDLSRSIHSVSDAIHKAVSEIGQNLRSGVGTVRQVLDEEEGGNLDTERIAAIGGALTSHTEALSQSIVRSAALSGDISQAVPRIMCDLQFQDRAKQRIENIVIAFSMLKTALADAGGDGGDLDHDWIEALLGKLTLAEMEDGMSRALLGVGRNNSSGSSFDLF